MADAAGFALLGSAALLRGRLRRVSTDLPSCHTRIIAGNGFD
jgi:hypothetical protein